MDKIEQVKNEMTNVLEVPGINSKGYGTIPKLVMQDRNLSRDAKAIYAYFCSFAGQGSQAFPSIKKICYDLKFGDTKTYYNHVKLLIKFGYVSIIRTNDSLGRFSKNKFILHQSVQPSEIA